MPSIPSRKPDKGAYVLVFGEHRGKYLRDVPMEYLDYLLGWDELFPATRKAIEEFLKTQAGYEPVKPNEAYGSEASRLTPKDWKDGREDAEDWRTM